MFVETTAADFRRRFTEQCERANDSKRGAGARLVASEEAAIIAREVSPEGYLSITDDQWTVIRGGLPLCAYVTEAAAREIAQQLKVQTVVGWNHARGGFVSVLKL